MKDELLSREDYLKEVGDIIVAKILFGKKDSDLVAWVQSIPRGKFSSVVKDAILAYINNNTSHILPVYDLKKDYKPTIAKSLSIGKGDFEIYTYLYSINKYLRSNKIKEILRHYMSKDLSKYTLQKRSTKVGKQISTPAIKNNRSKNNQNQLLKFSQLMNEGKY